MVYDYIFIDLDGTILDCKLRNYMCYKDIVCLFGGNIIDIEKYWWMKRNKIKQNVILKESDFIGSCGDFMQLWMQNIEHKKYLEYDKLIDGVIYKLNEWKQSNIKLVLVTMRNNKENLYWQLEKNNLYSFFDRIDVCSGGNGDAKYNSIKEVKFKKAVFIGDTETDERTAELLNIPFLAITAGLREKKYLNAEDYFESVFHINEINKYF